jgi:hypothetical protein
MKKTTIYLILLLLSSQLFAQAPKKAFSTTASLGITTPLLDGGLGLHLGGNPAYALSDYIALEGQLSYIYTRVTGSFLSGRTGNSHAVNTLAGGRFYLHAPEKRTRIYFNALLGGNYFQEKMSGQMEQREWGLGFSLGGYVAVSRVVVGLSYDTPQNVILKAGFIF